MDRQPLPDLQSFRVRIHGRVQGVGFRYWAQRQAYRLGVNGWVRNEPDGTVMVECEGPAPRLELFLGQLRQGPPGARVDRLETRPISPCETRHDFTIEF